MAKKAERLARFKGKEEDEDSDNNQEQAGGKAHTKKGPLDFTLDEYRNRKKKFHKGSKRIDKKRSLGVQSGNGRPKVLGKKHGGGGGGHNHKFGG